MSHKYDFMGRFGFGAVLAGAGLLLTLNNGCETAPKGGMKDGSDVPQMEDPGAATSATPRTATEPAPENVRWTPDLGATASGDPDQTKATLGSLADLGSGAAGRSGWSIAMATLTMPDHEHLAGEWVTKFREISGMNDVWVERAEQGCVVRYGSYSSFDTPQAKSDLAKIKSIEYNGRRPFARSYLSRLMSQTALGGASPLNLVHARDYLPDAEAVYSLQIGVYEPEKGEQTVTLDDCRKMAENAARQLRSQGELAFFYHGPNRSMVCVGVFGPDAVDPDTKIYSTDVLLLQKRFPSNAFNGRSLVEKWKPVEGSRTIERVQPSFLVQVPDR